MNEGGSGVEGEKEKKKENKDFLLIQWLTSVILEMF